MGLIIYLLSCQAKIFFRDRVAVLLTIFLPLVMGITTTYSLLPVSVDEKKVPTSNEVMKGDDALSAGAQVKKNGQQFLIEFVALSDIDHIDQFVKRLVANEEFSRTAFVEVSTDLEKALKKLDSGKINMLLVAKSSADNNDNHVQFAFSAMNPVLHGVAELLARELVSQLNLMVSGVEPRYRFEHFSVSASSRQPEAVGAEVDQHSRPLYNLSQVAFYLPNFLALSMLWLGLFSSALPLASERAEGVFTQLSTANLKVETLIITHVLWRILIGFFLSILFVLSGMFLLGVSGINDVASFFVAILLGNLFMTVFGVMLVSLSQSVQTVNVMTQIANLLLMFTSGLMLPLENVPDFLRYVSYVNPMTYIGDLLRQSMMNYQPMNTVGYNLIVLSIILSLMLLVIKFKWKWR